MFEVGGALHHTKERVLSHLASGIATAQVANRKIVERLLVTTDKFRKSVAIAPLVPDHQHFVGAFGVSIRHSPPRAASDEGLKSRNDP